VGRIAFLADRPPAGALPAVQSLGQDVKHEPLTPDALAHLPDLAPSVVIADVNMPPGHRR